MTMLPEAVPIIKDLKKIPKFIFTSKIAIEVEDSDNVGLIGTLLKATGKEVMVISRVPGIKYIHETPTNVRWVIMVNSEDGLPWLKYLVNLVNVIPGITLDLLMKIVNINPQLLNLPSELFLDPVIINKDISITPKNVPGEALRWIDEYIASGGDLYLMLRDNIKDLSLISKARLLIVDNMDLAEIYNKIIKSANQGFIVKADCEFCSENNALCLLLCPNADLIKELHPSSL